MLQSTACTRIPELHRRPPAEGGCPLPATFDRCGRVPAHDLARGTLDGIRRHHRPYRCHQEDADSVYSAQKPQQGLQHRARWTVICLTGKSGGVRVEWWRKAKKKGQLVRAVETGGATEIIVRRLSCSVLPLLHTFVQKR